MTEAQAFRRPLVIGVVGGVASGKSTLTAILREKGAQVIDADKIAHEVLKMPDVVGQLVQLFGEGILHQGNAEAHEIDRKKLGALVFGDEPENRARREQLEAIVHPLIRSIGRDRLAKLRQRQDVSWIVLDAPLLIEGGWVPFCDRIWFLDTPPELRCQWAMKRGWTKEQWQSRERSQLRLEEKRKHATDIIRNRGSREELAHQVHEQLDKLVSLYSSE